MKRMIAAAFTVLVWGLVFLELAFFVGVGIACQGC